MVAAAIRSEYGGAGGGIVVVGMKAAEWRRRRWWFDVSVFGGLRVAAGGGGWRIRSEADSQILCRNFVGSRQAVSFLLPVC